VVQLVRGIVLATRFSGHVDLSFDSVLSLYQDSNYGWLLRLVHSTGASFFFYLFIFILVVIYIMVLMYMLSSEMLGWLFI